VVSMGLGLDDKSVKSLRKITASTKWNAFDFGSFLPANLLLEGTCTHDHGHTGEHEHPTDPHIWLSPSRMAEALPGIARELSLLAPTKEDGIPANTKKTMERLLKMQQDGKAALKDKQERWFVSFHDSLQYFANDLGLKIAGVIELEPGIEPNQKQMKDLIDLCIKRGVRVIAVEPQFSDKNAAAAIREALKQKGIDAVFVEIDTMETADPKELDAEFYFRKMQKNIDALVRELK
jgi:zinc transport system substrate-binding protein